MRHRAFSLLLNVPTAAAATEYVIRFTPRGIRCYGVTSNAASKTVPSGVGSRGERDPTGRWGRPNQMVLLNDSDDPLRLYHPAYQGQAALSIVSSGVVTLTGGIADFRIQIPARSGRTADIDIKMDLTFGWA